MNKEMSEVETKSAAKQTQTTRRAFVKTASQVAITAPAVSVLLAATIKPASASIHPYCASPSGNCDVTDSRILDDFTFGNNEEDIDAINLGSNFSNWNGQANQDDVFLP